MQNNITRYYSGTFKKNETRLGGRGVGQNDEKCDIGGRGLIKKVMSLVQKNIASKIVFLLCLVITI